jgi:hypothetical protein
MQPLEFAPKGRNLNSPGRKPRVGVVHRISESPEGATHRPWNILPPLRGWVGVLFFSYLGLAPQAIQISPLRGTGGAGRLC